MVIFNRETRYIGIRRLKCKIDRKRYIAEEIPNEVPADKATCFLPWFVHGLRITNFRDGIHIRAVSVANEWTPTPASICLSIYIIRGIYRRLSWILLNISYPTILYLSKPSVKYLRSLHTSAFYEISIINRIYVIYVEF